MGLFGRIFNTVKNDVFNPIGRVLPKSTPPPQPQPQGLRGQPQVNVQQLMAALNQSQVHPPPLPTRPQTGLGHDIGAWLQPHIGQPLHNVLAPVVNTGADIVQGTGKALSIGPEDVRTMIALATHNKPAAKAAMQRGRQDISQVVGLAQALPRGIAQLEATAIARPNTPITNRALKVLFGDQPIQSLPEQYRQTKKQTGSVARAAVGTGLSGAMDIASVLPVLEGAKAGVSKLREGVPQVLADQSGSLGSKVGAIPSPTTKVAPKTPLTPKDKELLAGQGSEQIVNTAPLQTITNLADTSSRKSNKAAADLRTAYSGDKNAQIIRGNQIADTIRKATPNPVDRSALTWLNEAGGDARTLQKWLSDKSSALDSHRPAIQRAIELSKAPGSSFDLMKRYYQAAGEAGHKLGTINNILENYGNRIYKQEESNPVVGTDFRSGLGQTTRHGKTRSYETLYDAVKNGKVPATTDAADLLGIHNAEMAKVNTNAKLVKLLSDSGLGMTLREGEKPPVGMSHLGELRALARDERNARIDLYSQAKDLKPIQNKAERLVSTRNRWVRNLQAQVDRLNKQGLDISLSRSPSTIEKGNAFKYQTKDYIANAETTAKNRGVRNIGAADSVTGQLKVGLSPGRGASAGETRALLNDLVNLPPKELASIKNKIATRENHLGPIMDEIGKLNNSIDNVKAARQSIIEEARGINSPTRVAVPDYLAPGLKAITEPDYINKVDALRKVGKYQGFVKTVDLSVSAFHHFTMAMQALYQSHGGLDFANPKFWDNLRNQDTAKVEQDFAQHGGMTANIDANMDVMKQLTKSDSKLANAPVIKQAISLTQKNNQFLFGKLQRFLKTTDYGNKISQWVDKHPEASNAEVTAAKRSIAREVNAAYGGLNWEALGVNKSTVGLLRKVLLAPDWTYSNLELGKQAFKGGPGGAAARAHVASAVITGTILTQGLNKALTGHYTNQNGPGHEFEVEVRPGVYVSFFRGGIGDMIKLGSRIQASGPIGGTSQFLQGKLAPWARTGTGLLTNTNYYGGQLATKKDNAVTDTKNILAFIAASGGPVPFGLSGMNQLRKAGISPRQDPVGYGLVGTGLARPGTQKELKNVSQSGSTQGTPAVQNKTNATDQVKAIKGTAAKDQYGLQQVADGRYVYNINGKVNTTKNLKTAQHAIALDAFTNSPQTQKLVGDKYYYKDATGAPHSMSKDSYLKKQAAAAKKAARVSVGRSSTRAKIATLKPPPKPKALKIGKLPKAKKVGQLKFATVKSIAKPKKIRFNA